MTISVSKIIGFPKNSNMKSNHATNTYVSNAVTKTETTPINSNFSLSFKGEINSEPKILAIPFIEKYVSTDVIQKAIDTNPNITYILASKGLTAKIYPENIDSKLKTHLLSTYINAKKIAHQAKLDKKSKEILYKAALLHDIGKALIPDTIIQKPGKLTKSEKEIIDLHAKLGYEILKTTDVDFDVAEAVRLHHTPISRKNRNIIAQKLSVADVFSALKEERAYKKQMSNTEAFEIMTKTPALSQIFIDYLIKSQT